jgi:hypothetical protein
MLQAWAGYNRPLRSARSSPEVCWDAARQLMAAAAGLFLEQAERLKAVLQKANQRLHPLTDPLNEDLGTHRWLAADREEAYADWLEWILRQFGSPAIIFRLFDVQFDCTPWGACRVEIGRELAISSGHVDRTGRLDLWVRVGDQALVVIEIKKYGADGADTDKQIGYLHWVANRSEPHKDAILIAAAGEERVYKGFRLLTWEHVCLTLRNLVPELCATGKVGFAAMALSFVGAVEQNLLGFAVRDVVEGKARTFNSAIVDRVVAHLERSLEPREQ